MKMNNSHTQDSEWLIVRDLSTPEVSRIVQESSQTVRGIVLKGPGYSPILLSLEKWPHLEFVVAEDESGLMGALMIAFLTKTDKQISSEVCLTETIRGIVQNKFHVTDCQRKVSFDMNLTESDKLLLYDQFPNCSFTR